MFRGPESAARQHRAVEHVAEASKTAIEARLETVAERARSGSSEKANLDTARDLSGLGLEGVKLAETDKPGSSADLPNGKSSGTAQKQSARGS